jgi:hypothetical protein
LGKFRHKYAPSENGKLSFLRKFYRGGLRELPEDFLEFYQNLIDLATSNFVLPKQLERIIGIYEKKAPNERITLPNVDKYEQVDLSKINVIQLPEKSTKKPFTGIHRVNLINRDIMARTNSEEQRKDIERLKEQRNFAEMVKGDAFTLNLIDRLREELTKSGECDLNDPEEPNPEDLLYDPLE